MHLLVVSDIHATKTSGYKNLTKIKDIMSTEPIDHIIIPGDIVDDVESLKDYNFQKKLQSSLLEFTQEKPTIISYGNHDQMTKKDGIWQEGNKQLLKDTLSPLPNYHLLENGEIFKTDEITYSALSPDFNFYEGKDKTKKDFRAHNDYIDREEFLKFLNILKKEKQDIDIMIEAKKKDEALFRLIRQLKYKTKIKFIDETTFMI